MAGVESKSKIRQTKDDSPNKDSFLDILVKKRKYFLPLFAVFLLLMPIIINSISDKPIIYGYESYHHLKQAEELHGKNFHYLPLYISKMIFPENILPIISIVLGLIFIFLIGKIAEKIGISEKLSFIFTFFLICTPIFIYSFSTISAYSYFFFLYSVVIYLLLQEKSIFNYLAILPLFFSTTIDIFSNIFIISTLMFMYYKKKNKVPLILAIIAILFMAMNLILFNIPLVQGQFQGVNKIVDLISDFGSLAGISFFLIILAIMGLFISWKKKEYYFSYILLALVIITYFFSSQIILPFSLVIIFFASIMFNRLEEKRWNQEIIKKATIFLLILGIIFSLLSYFERIQDIPPNNLEKDTMLWIKENFSPERVVFSLPENSYFIEYFSGLNSFYSKHELDKNKEEISTKIMESNYVQDLFPLLEENDITIIYFDKKMKSQLPENYGLRFLLKNERINLVYQNEENEVWVFQ